MKTPKTFSYTIFQNHRRKPLSKQLSLDQDGNLQKRAAAQLSRGRALRKRSCSVKNLVETILKLPASCALSFGVCENPKVLVLSKEFQKSYQGPNPTVTRTPDYFNWPAGPGVMVLDYDPRSNEPAKTAEELIHIFRASMPELQSITMIAKPSTSSCIYNAEGVELVGIKGLHIFIACDQAQHIPYMGKLIADRLWLNGHGYIKLSSSGSMLERTLVDTSVWQPHRLIFGKAYCHPELTQRFPPPFVFPSNNEKPNQECWLNYATIIPLTQDERQAVEQLKKEAKNAISAEAHEVQERWIEKTARMSAGKDASPERLRECIESIRGCIEKGYVMAPELILYPQYGDPVTAGEIYSNPDKWDNKRFADPFEPEFNNDKRIGYAILKNCAEPYIYSHIHGGISYKFRTEEERKREISQYFNNLDAPQSQRERFEVIPISQLPMNFTSSWRIKNLLPLKGLAMVFGQSGSGKTFIALDICFSIAKGVSWRGHSVKKGHVVYIAAEGVTGVRKRIKAYADFYNDDLDLIPFGLIQDAPNLYKDEDILPLINSIKAFGTSDVVVIDTLAQVSPGANENTSDGMGPIIEKCKRIGAETGALVILVHHSGKDQLKGSRGWSGIKAALDTEIEVGKLLKERVARVTKQRDGESGLEFVFDLQSVYLGQDNDGEQITSCIVKHLDSSSVRYLSKMGKWQKLAFKAIENALEYGEEVLIETVIKNAINLDSGSYVENNFRDRRRENVKRALNDLAMRDLIIIKANKLVTLPQLPNRPQIDDCGDVA